MAFSVSILVSSQVYSGDLWKIHDVGYCNKLNAESDKKIQLSFVKPDMKEICEYVKQCHSR